MRVDGYFRVGRLSGVELRLHWSVPVGAVVFGALEVAPVVWLAYLLVLAVHALGHALIIESLGLELSGVDATGYGGQCRFRGSADALEHAVIAWGGVLAQLVLLALSALVSWSAGPLSSQVALDVLHTFIEVNLWVVAVNLLPFAPLDGARGWRVFGELTERGWTLSKLAPSPLWRWAARRRRRRVEGAGSGSTEPGERLGSVAPRRRPSPLPAVTGAAEVDGSAAEDDLGEKPSAEAQRELAALLERIGGEASRARKRR